MVYLIHFDKKYKHALHYIGYSRNVKKRVESHKLGTGARLLQVLNENGIGYKVVYIWPDGTRQFEIELKKQHNSKRYCPICNKGNKYGKSNLSESCGNSK